MNPKKLNEIRDSLCAGLCGCGYPSLAVGVIREVLEVMAAPYESRTARQHIEALSALLGPEESGAFWLILYTINRLGLIEHGSSVCFSWLTDKGRDALEFTRTYGDDPDRWPEVYWEADAPLDYEHAKIDWEGRQ